MGNQKSFNFRVFSSSFLLMNDLLELIRSHKMSGLSGPTFSTEKKKMP